MHLLPYEKSFNQCTLPANQIPSKPNPLPSTLSDVDTYTDSISLPKQVTL